MSTPKAGGFASSSVIGSSRFLHHVFRSSDDKSFGCFVHGVWPLSSLQKYPPVSAQYCAERGGKGSGPLAACSHVIQLCPQAMVLSSCGTRPQAWPGVLLWIRGSLSGDTVDMLSQNPPKSRLKTMRSREWTGTLKSQRCKLKSKPSPLLWPWVSNFTKQLPLCLSSLSGVGRRSTSEQ